MSEEANQLHLRPGVGNGRVGDAGIDERAITFDKALGLAVLPKHPLSPYDKNHLLTLGVKVGRPALISI